LLYFGILSLFLQHLVTLAREEIFKNLENESFDKATHNLEEEN
jgi:hypothetical protein